MSGHPRFVVGISYLVEIFLVYSTTLHMDYYPINYKVSLEIENWELSFLGYMKDDMLATIFFVITHTFVEG